MADETTSTSTESLTSGAATSTTGIASDTTTTSISSTNVGANISLGGESSFIDTLPDDLKNDPVLTNFKGKTAADVVKSFISAQRELGARIRIPSENASAEERKAFLDRVSAIPGVIKAPDPKDPKSVEEFFTKLGRPAKPEGYKLELPETVPADLPELNQFKQLSHQIGLNNQQAQALAAFEIQRNQAAVNGMVADAQRVKAELSSTWGNEFENNMKFAVEAANQYKEKFPNEHKALMEGSLGNNPIFLQMAAELGKIYRETGVIKGEPVTIGKTPEEALNAIKEIQRNSDHPAHPMYKGTASRAERQAAAADLEKLYQAAYPQKSNETNS